jgi:hypothetical protein
MTNRLVVMRLVFAKDQSANPRLHASAFSHHSLEVLAALRLMLVRQRMRVL